MELQPFNIVPPYVFQHLWKVTDTIYRLHFLWLQEITLMLPACFLSDETASLRGSLISGKKSKSQGHHMTNMMKSVMGVQEFPTATMLEGFWNWWPHGCLHCHAIWSVDVYEHTAASIVALGTELMAVLCTDNLVCRAAWQSISQTLYATISITSKLGSW